MKRRDDDYGALDDLLRVAEWEHDAPTLALDRSRLASPEESRTMPPPRVTGGGHDRRPRRLLTLVGLPALALLLVVTSFGVGRLFAEDPQPAQQDSPAGPDGSTGSTSDDGSRVGDAPYDGRVSDVQVAGSTASCQAPDSVDAGGNPVAYPSSHAHDGDLSTAWRCHGHGRGERLTITLPQETTVAEVGIVPGYAKTDPVNGADRYAENNRITRVRWTFDDGSSYVQRMSGAPDDRSMRTLRIPETATGSVVLEVLSSTRGPRNTIAVSEVRIARPAG